MISKLLRTLFRPQRGERGQIMFVAVAFIVVMAGGAAIAVDVGSYVSHRRSLQNDADAIALAASQNLPNGDSAHSAANAWASKNGVDNADMLVTVIQQNLPDEPNPKVRVELTESHSLTFMRLLGVGERDVHVTATAVITSPSGGDGIAPLSVTEAELAGATLGSEVTLKYDANNITAGNTSPIRVDGAGSGNCSSTDNYCRALEFGSSTVICAEGTSDYCGGPYQVDTEPGNKVGGTREAILWRINNTDPECSDFVGDNGVFEDDPTTSEVGVYWIKPECNTFANPTYESHRILIVPVIQQLCNGSCQVTIVTFGLFYLERIGDNGCTGNECEIVGRFVKTNQNVGLLSGTFNADAYNNFVRLVAD